MHNDLGEMLLRGMLFVVKDAIVEEIVWTEILQIENTFPRNV